ncbi:hypothetical protein [Salidesulfovibrio onnuriiensis]|uniref:hypothetical protein n=1 Tax=Salidesulfovibrio onnuriiensis TaxID=2583823 RepID=UPI0011C92A94|nr:hypothetical protein [Salidesulfovibrio onnuriiensis]
MGAAAPAIMSIVASVASSAIASKMQKKGPSQSDAMREERERQERERKEKEAEERRQERYQMREAREIERKRLLASDKNSTLANGGAGLTDAASVQQAGLKQKLGE